MTLQNILGLESETGSIVIALNQLTTTFFGNHDQYQFEEDKMNKKIFIKIYDQLLVFISAFNTSSSEILLIFNLKLIADILEGYEDQVKLLVHGLYADFLTRRELDTEVRDPFLDWLLKLVDL